MKQAMVHFVSVHGEGHVDDQCGMHDEIEPQAAGMIDGWRIPGS